MSRLFTVLNYFCIAICAVGIYSSYRLLSLKPWKVENLDTKLVAQLEKWQAPELEGVKLIESSLGEKKPDAILKDNIAAEPAKESAKPVVVAEPKKAAPAKNIAKIEPTKPDLVEVEPKKPEPAPKVVKIAKVEPVVAKPLVETPKIEPEPEKVVAVTAPKKAPAIVPTAVTPEPKKAEPVSIAKAPVVAAAPEVVKSVAPTTDPEPMLLADASTMKALQAAENFPETNTHKTTQTRDSTKKPPLRKKETTQTKPEKTTPALGKKSPTISLSSMLEVDMGAVAPR